MITIGTVGNTAVEVDDSNCIVLRDRRVHANDQIITVTNVDELTGLLHLAQIAQQVTDEAIHRGRDTTLDDTGKALIRLLEATDI